MLQRVISSIDRQYLSPSKIQKQQFQVQTKEDGHKLPLYILPDHRIIVFTNSPIYKKIYHHLKALCQPLYRPKTIHEYKITKFSLYTAMVLHYTGQQIVQILKKLSKNKIFPSSLQKQIMEYMKYAGQVRFSLIDDNYYIFTSQKIALLIDQYIERVQDVVIEQRYDFHIEQLSEQVQLVEKREQNQQIPYIEILDINQKQQKIEQQEQQFMYNNKGKQRKRTMTKYRIIGDYFEVTKRLIANNIPIVQQFDFKRCKTVANIDIQMNNDVKLRFYQEAALQNVFISGKARSGLIILPCGAGKSLVAIQIIQRIKKKTVIFCQNQTSAAQWKQQIIRWTTLQRGKIIILSSKYKNQNPKQMLQCSVFITTYSMVGLKRDRQNRYLQATRSVAWGVCIADQVHKLPAQTFQSVLKKYKFYLKIGLTATPYRQDKKIDNLYYMIGPKLYEQNWLDLVNQGCLAKPYCVQILCEMPECFRNSYQSLNKSQLLHTANPQKFKVLQYLIRKHTSFGDKILVFCDRPKILQKYAKLLKRPFIHGQVSEQQRLHFYGAFKTIKQFNVLFVSRVGDTAIDLPCANVGIQLGMHYKSRRQQVQRMGRIMRPKDNPNNQFNAFFYTLVSLGTDEADFCRQRQKILIDQGFQHQIKMAKDFNYSGINMINLDEKQHLLYILSEHIQGDNLLNKNVPQKREPTKIIKRQKKQQEYVYQQQQY